MTQFEALTAAAYAHLAEAGVEVAVVEAGLGGRWDATNVIGAPIVVLTNVGLEHTRWLGPTVTDIAREKLAVVAGGREPVTLVLGADLHPEADAEARLVADSSRPAATIVRAPAAPPDGVDLLARGAFQRRNFAVACAAAEACLGRLDPAAVRAAAASTIVPGRFEVLPGCAGDGAPRSCSTAPTTPSGIAALAGSLPEFLAGRPLVAVLSVLDDKDAAAMLATLLPLCAGVVFTTNANPRALSPATLASLAGQVDGGGWDGISRVEADPHRAVALARELAGEVADGGAEAAGAGGVVLATGSIYLIADLVRPDGRAGDRRCEPRGPVGAGPDRRGGGDRRARDPRVLRARLRPRAHVPLGAARCKDRCETAAHTTETSATDKLPRSWSPSLASTAMG